MKKMLLALLASVVCASAAQAQLPPARTVAQVTDSLARAFLAGRGSPSVAIGVVRGGQTLVMQGWGKADLENDVAATDSSVYRIGSVTKQFTAATVMQLVEQKKLQLDDSIGRYLPTLPAAWRGVTIRQLLNHTSGIPSYTDIGPAWVRRWGEEMSPDTIIALTANAPMWFAPGTKWQYDNTGYVILGMLIEKQVGGDWGAELERRFFKPLGMTATRNCLALPIIRHRVHGYQQAGQGWTNAPYLAMSQPYAAGALCSTVHDLATWNVALHTGKVVSPASYRLMTTPEGAATTGTLKYGFGLGQDTAAGHAVISHGGGIHGFITANLWVPDAQLSVTVLTNSGSARAEVLAKQVARAALGVPLERPPVAKPLPAALQNAYTGVYAMEGPLAGRDFTIALAGDHLTGMLSGQAPVPLLYYGEHTFGAEFDPSLRLIFTVSGDKASAMTLIQGGRSVPSKRKQ